MALEFIIEPNSPPITWEQFCQRKGPAVAFDGYVIGGPNFDEQGLYFNFNHHEGVDRLATRATCEQVMIAICEGVLSCLIDGTGEPHGVVYMIDCDEDCCTSRTLLKHGSMIVHLLQSKDRKEQRMLNRLNRLVWKEGILDATAGAYCFLPEMPIIKQLAWIFQPYRAFRLVGGTREQRTAERFGEVMDAVEKRILRYIEGRGRSITLDTRYESIGGGKDWVMVREIGMHARTGMFMDGIRAYVSVRERQNGMFDYTIARMAPFIHFPIPLFQEEFNQMEGCGEDHWGGSHICIGSPLVRGSTLPPRVIEQKIQQILTTG